MTKKTGQARRTRQGYAGRAEASLSAHYACAVPILRRTYLLVALIAAFSVLAAACGDDDPELSATDEPTATPVPTATDQTASPTVAADDGGTTEGEDANAVDGEPDDTAPSDEGADDSSLTPGGGEAVPTPTQAPISGEPAFTGSSKLSTVGLDEVFFGDTVEDAGIKASTDWVGLPTGGAIPRCYTVQPSGGPAGLVFTVLDGRIERVDITNAAITTLSGAGVGSTQAQLFDLFGERLEETETETGSEIMFVPTDADDREFRIIWTLDGVAAATMRAGRVPGVLTSSPCG